MLDLLLLFHIFYLLYYIKDFSLMYKQWVCLHGLESRSERRFKRDSAFS